MKNTYVQIVAAIFIFLFFYTAISKIIDLGLFKAQMQITFHYKIFVYVIIWLLPLVEIIVAFMLLIPSYRTRGFLVSTIMMIIFIIYIACLMMFWTHLPCSCGGIIEMLSWKQHLILNIFLLLLSTTGYYVCKMPEFRMDKLNSHSDVK